MNLHLLQLGDSALPIGGYSHSWGLEAAIARGIVGDAPALERWVRQWLSHSLGPLDGVVVAALSGATEEDVEATARQANELLWTGLAPPSLRQASKDMGEQLLTLAASWHWAAGGVRTLRRSDARPWHHAPVFAILARAAGARARDALLVYLHQAALGMIGAGVRAIPIGHTHGQEVLARMQNDLKTLAADLADRPFATAGSNSPAYDILCHEQTRLYTRIFRS